MLRKIFFVAVLIMLPGCSNNKDAKQALLNLGFSKITTTGVNFFSCGKNSFYRTGFRATNVNGRITTGTVCSGVFFKGTTIRF